MANRGQNEPILSVSEVNAQVNELIQAKFPQIYIEGEIKDLRIAPSGHWYFSLSDEHSSLRCVLWASTARRLKRAFEDGELVRIRANLNIYEVRGEFQAQVRHIELAGEGALQAAFEELKDKLSREGLFDADRKRSLPEFPRHIVIVTSPEADALRDVVTNIQRRYPPVKLSLQPTSVQGDNAPREIVAAFERISLRKNLPDLIVLTRGGGSLMDLAAFNSEEVARAIVASPKPVVSAIGHEPDVTISDYVADLRAATPSTAAEVITPDWRELHGTFSAYASHLTNTLRTRVNSLSQTIDTLSSSIQSPDDQLLRLRLQIDSYRTSIQRRVTNTVDQTSSSIEMSIYQLENAPNSARRSLYRAKEQLKSVRSRFQEPIGKVKVDAESVRRLRGRIDRAGDTVLERKSAQLDSETASILAKSPITRIRVSRTEVQHVFRQLQSITLLSFSNSQSKFTTLVRALRAVSPLATIERGFAVVARPNGTRWGQPVRSIEEVKPGDQLRAHVVDGSIDVSVNATAMEDFGPDDEAKVSGIT